MTDTTPPIPDGHLTIYLVDGNCRTFPYSIIKFCREDATKFTVVAYEVETGFPLRTVSHWWPWTAIRQVSNVTNSDEYMKQFDEWLEKERVKAAIEGRPAPDEAERLVCSCCMQVLSPYIHHGVMN